MFGGVYGLDIGEFLVATAHHRGQYGLFDLASSRSTAYCTLESSPVRAWGAGPFCDFPPVRSQEKIAILSERCCERERKSESGSTHSNDRAMWKCPSEKSGSAPSSPCLAWLCLARACRHYVTLRGGTHCDLTTEHDGARSGGNLVSLPRVHTVIAAKIWIQRELEYVVGV